MRKKRITEAERVAQGCNCAYSNSKHAKYCWFKEQTSLPEQLHSWYLEAVKKLKPESFNPNANKPYSEITDEQKSIDIYIANKITNLFSQEKEKWTETILCAAIWYKSAPSAHFQPRNIHKGVVVSGYRHSHCLAIFVSLTGKRGVEVEAGEMVQGFLTSKNRFVDRKEAQIIHKTTVGKSFDPNGYRGEELFSEDLY